MRSVWNGAYMRGNAIGTNGAGLSVGLTDWPGAKVTQADQEALLLLVWRMEI